MMAAAEPARLPTTPQDAAGRPRAPGTLGTDGKRLWHAVVAEFDVREGHHLELLRLAAEAVDRTEEARAAIARDGAYVEGRFGLKAHPALAVERDSAIRAARLLRELGLDIEAVTTPRPPSRWRA